MNNPKNATDSGGYDVPADFVLVRRSTAARERLALIIGFTLYGFALGLVVASW